MGLGSLDRARQITIRNSPIFHTFSYIGMRLKDGERIKTITNESRREEKTCWNLPNVSKHLESHAPQFSSVYQHIENKTALPQRTVHIWLTEILLIFGWCS